jgi:hypothetical protein
LKDVCINNYITLKRSLTSSKPGWRPKSRKGALKFWLISLPQRLGNSDISGDADPISDRGSSQCSPRT